MIIGAEVVHVLRTRNAGAIFFHMANDPKTPTPPGDREGELTTEELLRMLTSVRWPMAPDPAPEREEWFVIERAAFTKRGFRRTLVRKGKGVMRFWNRSLAEAHTARLNASRPNESVAYFAIPEPETDQDGGRELRDAVDLNGAGVLDAAATDVQHRRSVGLRGCRNLGMLIAALRQRREPRGDHGALALVEVPAPKVHRDDEPDRIFAVEVAHRRRSRKCYPLVSLGPSFGCPTLTHRPLSL
jgi:hypothetical protein